MPCAHHLSPRPKKGAPGGTPTPAPRPKASHNLWNSYVRAPIFTAPPPFPHGLLRRNERTPYARHLPLHPRAGRSAGPAAELLAGLPPPVEPEALTMSANHRGRLDDQQGRLPARPYPRQPRPQDPVAPPEFEPLDGTLQYAELVTQGQVLGGQRRGGCQAALSGTPAPGNDRKCC